MTTSSMTTMVTAERRAHFEQRFASEVTWRDGTVDIVPTWYSQLVTDLILATGDEPIRYFSASYMAATESQVESLIVVAFTDELVAYAYLDSDMNTSQQPLEVLVTARRMLSSFALESDTASEVHPLESVRITVSYPTFSRSLPLGASVWDDREKETDDLIACLRRDLVA